LQNPNRPSVGEKMGHHNNENRCVRTGADEKRSRLVDGAVVNRVGNLGINEAR